MGDFAAYASAKGAGEVYAFEPSPPAFNYLVQTTKLNPNIYPFQEGLGDAVSEIELFVDPANAQCNSFLDGDGVCRDAIRVPVTTIDAFVAEHGLSRVDFIKISVQGYDMHLLRGARKTLQRFAPKLSMLYCNAHSVPYSMEDVRKLIKKFNPKYRVMFRGKKLFAAVPDL
ncbi:FkbM family methyltransferase [Fretibacterium fastidiosum]|uniref:FkbM family methyltransferase n=2 Tax=Fretibacterium fastidiosum TaxID=651822 RepID=UPI0038FCA79B